MTDRALFAAGPGLALVTLGSVTLLRYLLVRQRGPMPSSAWPQARQLVWDSWWWRIGLCGTVAVHLLLLLLPMKVLAWNRIHWQLLVLESAAFAFGVAALVGLIALLRNQLRSAASSGSPVSFADAGLLGLLLVQILSGLAMAILYRWASSWSTVTLVPYVRSLLALDARLALMSGMPYVVKLHVFSGIALVGLLPFTHAIDLVLLPVDRLLSLLAAPWPRARQRAWRLLEELGRRGAAALSLKREED